MRIAPLHDAEVMRPVAYGDGGSQRDVLRRPPWSAAHAQCEIVDPYPDDMN